MYVRATMIDLDSSTQGKPVHLPEPEHTRTLAAFRASYTEAAQHGLSTSGPQLEPPKRTGRTLHEAETFQIFSAERLSQNR